MKEELRKCACSAEADIVVGTAKGDSLGSTRGAGQRRVRRLRDQREFGNAGSSLREIPQWASRRRRAKKRERREKK
jgi:hypothetical protein